MKKILLQAIRLSPFKISVFITTIMLALYAYNLGIGNIAILNLMDKKWIDFIQKNRGTVEHSDQIVIAAVDSKSIDKYGRWPWSREIIANLVQTLNDYYKVNTIGFDIVFSEPQESHLKLIQNYKKQFEQSQLDETIEGEILFAKLQELEQSEDRDAKFGEVYANYSNVVLGYTFFNEDDVKHLTKKEIKKAQRRLRHSSIKKVKGYGALKKSYSVTQGFYPEMTIEKISGKKPLLGYFTARIDPEDGVVRRVETVVQVGKRYFPALSLQMLSHYLNEPIEIIGDETGILEIRLGEKHLNPFPNGAFWINYKGPAKTFKHYSIADILDRSIPIEQLQDKMILIGVTEVGILDLRVTPVSEAYPGVEVQANILENMLTESYFRYDFSNDVYTLLLILISGLSLGIILPRMKLLYSISFVIILLVGYTLLHRYLVIYWLTWPSYIYVFLTIFLTAVGVTQYMFFISDKDKRFIKSAFQQYLSPAVISQLMEDPDMLKLGGEERVMTALFSDVKGFSTISEKLTPNELVFLLNEYLTEMSDIILKYEGTVDKFEGDAIIAFFGAPVNFQDHATRAALVCLEMQNRLAEMRTQWREEGRLELYHRIGINTGPMVVGNMGSRSRFDYTMMGNAVNLAARLEGVNKMYKNEILMSENTYTACQNEIEARELDMIRVVGIHQPVRIYEILSRKGELDNHRRAAFEIFASGLEFYRQQDWDRAEQSFKETLVHLPDDGPSSVFIERCHEYRQFPPPADWDNVYVATSK